MPGLDLTNWLGAYAPKGTPKDIVAKLNAAFNAAMADPDRPSADRRSRHGNSAARAADARKAFAAYLKAEMDKWGAIIRESGIKAQ